jgi:hypothetical protein
MNECVIVLMCDVSKLITEERHTPQTFMDGAGAAGLGVLFRRLLGLG